MHAALLFAALSFGQPNEGWIDVGEGWRYARNGVDIGWVRKSDGVYFVAQGGKWVQTADVPPVFPPGVVGQNFGVVDVARKDARNYGVVPDDGKLLRVTVVGADDKRKPVVEALKPFAEKCVLKDYPPSHWAMAGVGFVDDMTPTVYVQSGDGKVLHHGPAETAVEALRRLIDGYDPKKDPNALLGMLNVGGIAKFVPAIVLAVIVFLILRKKEN